MRRIRLCSRRASSSSSSAYSFSARHPLPEGDFERPTPVLLISGEGLGVNLWRPYAELLSKRGYCGSVMSIDPATRSVRQAARSIENAVRRSGYWPPVMIAHSSSSLVAQKYLESFSLAGLVMVSPFPTDPSAAASRALNLLDEVLLARGVSTADVQQGEHNLSNEELAQCLRRLYNCVDISDVLETQGSRLPIALLREMSSDAACKVNLEPAPVPMLVVRSAGDLFFTTDDCIHTKKFYGLADADVRELPGDSRVPMLTDIAAFDSCVFDWIENID